MAKEIKLNFLEVIYFEWDEGNRDKNWLKHRVDYRECEQVFLNNPVYFYDEGHSQKEERFIAYGITDQNRELFIVFTIRNNKIRVISARDQNKKERRIYEKTKANTKI